MILELLISAIIVEAITEILVDSKIFQPLRELIGRTAYPEGDIGHPLTRFIYNLISCGYCLSVWVALCVSFISVISGICLITKYNLINIVLNTFLLHRLSNWLHVAYMVFYKGRVITLDINVKESRNDA